MNLDGKLVSVEHSRLINPKLQEVEKYRDKIIKSAQKIFEEKYKAQLYVLLTFKDIDLEGRKKFDYYVNEIYSLIESIYLNNQLYEFSISSRNRYPSFEHSFLEHISVNNTLDINNWQHFGAYFVDWIDTQWLTTIIKKKELNISKYKKEFDQNWLLLVANFGSKASANRTDFIDYSFLNTRFDKVFIHHYMSNEIIVVK